MYGKRGVQNLSNAAVGPLRLDQHGKLVVAGDLAEAAMEGRLFSVANQAAVAVTANLATTWTGLGVANPTGSGKLLVFYEFGWATDVVNPAEGVVGLMTSTDSGFAAALAARCARNGYKTSVAYCDNGATIATPVLERICGSTMEGAITTVPALAPKIIDLKGGIVLAAGRSLLTYHSIGGTASLMFHFVWEEVEA
jgi:hypothetical protein